MSAKRKIDDAVDLIESATRTLEKLVKRGRDVAEIKDAIRDLEDAKDTLERARSQVD